MQTLLDTIFSASAMANLNDKNTSSVAAFYYKKEMEEPHSSRKTFRDVYTKMKVRCYGSCALIRQYLLMRNSGVLRKKINVYCKKIRCVKSFILIKCVIFRRYL